MLHRRVYKLRRSPHDSSFAPFSMTTRSNTLSDVNALPLFAV